MKYQFRLFESYWTSSMFSVSYERINGRWNVESLYLCMEKLSPFEPFFFNPRLTQLSKDWMIQCIIRRWHRTMKTGKITNHFICKKNPFRLFSLVDEKNIDQIYGVYSADVFVESTQHPQRWRCWCHKAHYYGKKIFMLQQLNLIFLRRRRKILSVKECFVDCWKSLSRSLLNIQHWKWAKQAFSSFIHITFSQTSRYVRNFLLPFGRRCWDNGGGRIRKFATAGKKWIKSNYVAEQKKSVTSTKNVH